MSRYIPVNRFNGAEGPSFEFMSLAAFWIASQVDSSAWQLRQVGS